MWLKRAAKHAGQSITGVRHISASCAVPNRHHEDVLTSFAEQTRAINEEFAEVFGEQAAELDGSMKPGSAGRQRFSPQPNDAEEEVTSRYRQHGMPMRPVTPPAPLPPPPPPPPSPPPTSPPPPSYATHPQPHYRAQQQTQTHDYHYSHQHAHVHPHYLYHPHYAHPAPAEPLHAHELRQLHEAIERVEAKLDTLLQESKK